MLKSSKSCLWMVMTLLILSGCNSETDDDADMINTSATGTSTTGGGHAGGGHAAEVGHEHSHAGDDALVWEGQPELLGDLEIKLGHHAEHLHAGEMVEPAVSITRNGDPVGDAEVFNSLLDADGETVLAEEVATVYEPETSEEPAHYAQGELAIPEGVESVTIRFRIVPADGEEATFDRQVMVE